MKEVCVLPSIMNMQIRIDMKLHKPLFRVGDPVRFINRKSFFYPELHREVGQVKHIRDSASTSTVILYDIVFGVYNCFGIREPDLEKLIQVQIT